MAEAGGASAAAVGPHGIVVGESEVFDQAEYDAYRALGGPTVAAHGGTLLYSGTRSEVLEGTRTWQRQVAIDFATTGAARAWHGSPEYTAAAVQRRRGARSSIWIAGTPALALGGPPSPPPPGGPPRAYLLGEVTAVRDPDAYARYLREVVPVLAPSGARYLVRGGAVDHVEGPWRPERVVLIEFPSWDAAAAWYGSPEYAPLAALRHSSADFELILIEGRAAAPQAQAAGRAAP